MNVVLACGNIMADAKALIAGLFPVWRPLGETYKSGVDESHY